MTTEAPAKQAYLLYARNAAMGADFQWGDFLHIHKGDVIGPVDLARDPRLRGMVSVDSADDRPFQTVDESDVLEGHVRCQHCGTWQAQGNPRRLHVRNVHAALAAAPMQRRKALLAAITRDEAALAELQTRLDTAREELAAADAELAALGLGEDTEEA